MGFFRKLRTRFEELEAKGKKLSECEHYMEEVSRRVRQPNRCFDEPGSAQPPAFKFRTGTFLVIIDSIDGELQKRLVAHTGIAKRFGFLQKLKDLPDDQMVTSAQSLQEPYIHHESDELLQPSGFLNMEPAKKSLDGCDCLSSYSCSFSSPSFGRDVPSW